MRRFKIVNRLSILCVLVFFMAPVNLTFAAGNTQIDGYYDDWEGIPKTKITHHSYNVQEFHEVAVVMDEEYLYAYVRLSDYYQSQIPVNEYYLTINGKTKAFNILGKDAYGNVDYNLNVYQLPVGTYIDQIGVFYRDNARTALGEAAVTITQEKPNDTLEFRIRLSVLENLYGFSEGTIKNGAQIEFYNPNLGGNKVSLRGTATGAAVVAVIGTASVGAALFFKKRKKLI